MQGLRIIDLSSSVLTILAVWKLSKNTLVSLGLSSALIKSLAPSNISSSKLSSIEGIYAADWISLAHI